MSVLVDSSVWIDFFRDIGQADNLEFLIAENALQGNLKLLTNDKHFFLMSKHFPLEIFE